MRTPTTYDLEQTDEFGDWYAGLRDRKAAEVVAVRLTRMKAGLFGTVKTVGEGVSEAKVDFGPGYRLYYTIRNRRLIILLVGGDKSSQRRDIKLAHKLAKQLE